MRRARYALYRWRRKPRRTLRRWDLQRHEIGVGFALLVFPWALAIGLLSDAADATRWSTRAWFLAAGLLAVATGIGTAWLAVLYLRRPVLDEPEPQPVSSDETARADSEQAAWRARGSI